VLDADQTRELVNAAAGGDRGAWERLVDEFSGLVWSVIRGCGLYGAEGADVSQTVWLRFVEHVGRLREADRAGAWLATTARHECFRVLRRAGRQIATADVPEVAVSDETERVVTSLVDADDRSAVLDALERVPVRCRELLRLMASEPPLTYDEIAEVLAVPRGWIGPTRGRCIKHLRQVLGRGTDADGEGGIRHIVSGSDRGKEAE
jgi:RNA polymerase sigma factor (sigma-70 family)